MNWRAWLKLSRIGGITSALGTGQAGLYLGSAGADLRQIPMGLSASASLYLFGMVSNDGVAEFLFKARRHWRRSWQVAHRDESLYATAKSVGLT